MDLEFHQLDLRYAALRTRNTRREQRLLASLSERGQQVPVVVIAAGTAEPASLPPPSASPVPSPPRFILLDGYKRVRALGRLRADTVRATCWSLGEAEALLLERLMRTGGADSALEQGWVLCELRDRFGLRADELARRFDKTVSWVSRRLGLVSDLPESIQARVRGGEIGPHVAMKYLLPLARANRRAAEEIAAGLPAQLGSRTASALYAAYTGGRDETRKWIRENPALFVRAHEEAQRAPPVGDASPAAQLRKDLGALCGIARRLGQRFAQGLGTALPGPERAELVRLYQQARREVERLSAHLHEEERVDARSNDA